MNKVFNAQQNEVFGTENIIYVVRRYKEITNKRPVPYRIHGQINSNIYPELNIINILFSF
jgi:hypothetical protein